MDKRMQNEMQPGNPGLFDLHSVIGMMGTCYDFHPLWAPFFGGS